MVPKHSMSIHWQIVTSKLIVTKSTGSRHLWSEPQSKWSQLKPNGLLKSSTKHEPVTRVDSRDPPMSNTPIWRCHYLGEVVFPWRSEINIDYRLIQCITGFCSSPLPIFKLSLQVPWTNSRISPIQSSSRFTDSVQGSQWSHCECTYTGLCCIQ